MNEKKAPVIIKRDTTENWLKAVNYKPSVGTICVYDNEDGSVQLKIGDGHTLVNDLQDLLVKSTPAHVEDGILHF